MIKKELLLNVKRIITHANCGDGMASAMILSDALAPGKTVEFLHYDTPEHREMEITEGMIFCDFSPHPDLATKFLDAGAIVLDHHKTAKPIVDRFIAAGRGVFGDEALEPGVCGATLAYRYVWLKLMNERGTNNKRVFEFAMKAGIYDTWQKDSVLWEAACEQQEALKFWDAKTLLEAPVSSWSGYLQVGPTLMARKKQAVEKAIGSSLLYTGPGVNALRLQIFQGLSETSLAAEVLGDKVDLVVGFSYTVEAGEEKIMFSLRSHTGFDCGAFCKDHGGGGHTAAAGFSVKVHGSPYSQFLSTLSEWQDRQ